MSARRRSRQQLSCATVIALVLCVSLLVVVHIERASCMSLERLALDRNEIPNDMPLYRSGSTPGASSALVDDVKLEAVSSADGHSNMYVAVPSSNALENSSENHNEDLVAPLEEESSDMLMMETEDAPIRHFLELPSDSLANTIEEIEQTQSPQQDEKKAEGEEASEQEEISDATTSNYPGESNHEIHADNSEGEEAPSGEQHDEESNSEAALVQETAVDGDSQSEPESNTDFDKKIEEQEEEEEQVTEAVDGTPLQVENVAENEVEKVDDSTDQEEELEVSEDEPSHDHLETEEIAEHTTKSPRDEQLAEEALTIETEPIQGEPISDINTEATDGADETETMNDEILTHKREPTANTEQPNELQDSNSEEKEVETFAQGEQPEESQAYAYQDDAAAEDRVNTTEMPKTELVNNGTVDGSVQTDAIGGVHGNDEIETNTDEIQSEILEDNSADEAPSETTAESDHHEPAIVTELENDSTRDKEQNGVDEPPATEEYLIAEESQTHIADELTAQTDEPSQPFDEDHVIHDVYHDEAAQTDTNLQTAVEDEQITEKPTDEISSGNEHNILQDPTSEEALKEETSVFEEEHVTEESPALADTHQEEVSQNIEETTIVQEPQTEHVTEGTLETQNEESQPEAVAHIFQEPQSDEGTDVETGAHEESHDKSGTENEELPITEKTGDTGHQYDEPTEATDEAQQPEEAEIIQSPQSSEVEAVDQFQTTSEDEATDSSANVGQSANQMLPVQDETQLDSQTDKVEPVETTGTPQSSEVSSVENRVQSVEDTESESDQSANEVQIVQEADTEAAPQSTEYQLEEQVQPMEPTETAQPLQAASEAQTANQLLPEEGTAHSEFSQTSDIQSVDEAEPVEVTETAQVPHVDNEESTAIPLEDQGHPVESDATEQAPQPSEPTEEKLPQNEDSQTPRDEEALQEIEKNEAKVEDATVEEGKKEEVEKRPQSIAIDESTTQDLPIDHPAANGNQISAEKTDEEPAKEPQISTSMLTTIIQVPQQPQQQPAEPMPETTPTTTVQPLNVVDSVLNYVNASFINQMNSQQQQQQQEEEVFSSELRRYEGAQVWRIVVQNERDRKLAEGLQKNFDGQLWKEVKQEVDYLLKPQFLADAERYVRTSNLSRIVLIDNLQKVIEVENPPAEHIAQLQNRKGHRLTWEAYHRLEDIHGFFDYMAKTYPDICSVETIGYSIQKRPLKILKISNGNAANPSIWIDGGMHAREWISPASVTYVANQIVEGWDDLPDYMRNINWYIHAVANPDGYEYSHTTDRLWRKNMRSHGRQCPGVDLNRNFGYMWGGKGTSANPCSQTYRGSKAFSEPETFYISKFISNFPRHTFKAYLSFHSYGQYILYPWGYDYHVTKDQSDLDRVARQAGSIITKTSGTKYTVGSSAITLYPAAGGSDDWAKGFAGIKYAYTIEMGDTGRYGFVLPAGYIESNGKDAYTFVETVARAITMGKNSRRRKFRTH